MPTSHQTLHAIREPLKAVDGLGRQVHFAFEYLREQIIQFRLEQVFIHVDVPGTDTAAVTRPEPIRGRKSFPVPFSISAHDL